MTVLPNGNFVVTDPGYDAPGPIINVGAAFLYRPDGSLISTLRGSRTQDAVGGGGVVVLANGNYVVLSPNWANGSARAAGAATFVPGTTGIEGEVTVGNSLVGSSNDDQVGSDGVSVLGNGNYLVRSRFWDRGSVINAGSVTFGSGDTGVSGVVSPANSLVGSHERDQIGYGDVRGVVVELRNGNFLVISPDWRNLDGAITWGSGSSGVTGHVSEQNSLIGSDLTGRLSFDNLTLLGNGNYVVRSRGTPDNVGAVTFGSGTGGVSGLPSPGNSLMGSRSGDAVGTHVTALTNGNYVVASPDWDHGALVDVGAVTFVSGTAGLVGTVSAANSLIGSQISDRVGYGGVTALDNGNYVVASRDWANGTAFRAGAATFASGQTGIVGVVSTVNSLVGTSSNDNVGDGVVALRSGNYVVESPMWRNAGVGVGAVTFGSGSQGISGVVSPANSLIGSAIFDGVGRVTPLANGNYVVVSRGWDNGGILDAGAVTFASGLVGRIGVVSLANSLAGSSNFDRIGTVTALPNGNYLVASPDWNHNGLAGAGAVTFGSGTNGVSGTISAANSLVGAHADQQLGSSFDGDGITILGNGNYVVRSTRWSNGTLIRAGALTLGSGSSGITGSVSAANSLIGGSAEDRIGYSPNLQAHRLFPVGNGHFVVQSPSWTNGTVEDAGAITLALADGRVRGVLDGTHSVLGEIPALGSTLVHDYDAERNQLIVGQGDANRIILHRSGVATETAITAHAPAEPGELVQLVARVSAPTAPGDGYLRFKVSHGGQCTDPSATAVSATTVEFTCGIRFPEIGRWSVLAEYLGSLDHAHSSSTSTVVIGLYADGFESP